jgi:hypothetical protein
MKQFTQVVAWLGVPLFLLAADRSPSDQRLKKFYTTALDKGGLTNVALINAVLPNVLILGDSISIGIPGKVREGLKGWA